MAGNPEQAAAPIRRSVLVSWDPDHAFRRFTAEFAEWWPRYALSIGGRRVKRVVLECRVGGLIYEEHHDGTRFRWGTVVTLDPPRRIAFTYHATRAESDAQHVEVTFVPEGTGTRVELVSSGWEKMGKDAQRAHGGFRLSWGCALDGFAGRFSGVRILFTVMCAAIDITGQRNSFIRGSLGRMDS